MAQQRPFLFRSTTVACVLSVAMLATAGVPGTVRAQSTTLRPLADAADIALGAAVDVDALDDTGYQTLLVDHVNLVSTKGDLSMAVVQPEQGVFDFSQAETIVDFGVEHDMATRGHELIGEAVPGWVSAASWTAESLAQVLRDHVSAVVGHFRERNPGVIVQWDVVGDAFLADGTPRATIWQQVIGDDYLRIAFEAAREADPDALLFYDDFYDDVAVTQDAVASGVPIVPGANAERTTCDAVPKCDGVRDRIAALVADGVPIDGIGFQSHLFSPDPADFTQFTDWVGQLGLQWAVTEFDVPLPVTEISNPETLDFQAQVYADALAACTDAVRLRHLRHLGDQRSVLDDSDGDGRGLRRCALVRRERPTQAGVRGDGRGADPTGSGDVGSIDESRWCARCRLDRRFHRRARCRRRRRRRPRPGRRRAGGAGCPRCDRRSDHHRPPPVLLLLTTTER